VQASGSERDGAKRFNPAKKPDNVFHACRHGSITTTRGALDARSFTSALTGAKDGFPRGLWDVCSGRVARCGSPGIEVAMRDRVRRLHSGLSTCRREGERRDTDLAGRAGQRERSRHEEQALFCCLHLRLRL